MYVGLGAPNIDCAQIRGPYHSQSIIDWPQSHTLGVLGLYLGNFKAKLLLNLIMQVGRNSQKQEQPNGHNHLIKYLGG